MSQNPKLSLIMVVHNSEDVIERSIRSAYDLVDELVIVDGESTDKTVDILKKLDKDKKTRILSEKNHPNFILNKQKALDSAEGDWVLELDDDEVVTPELATEIKKTLTQSVSGDSEKTSQKLAFWIPRLNHFLGKPLRKGGQYPDYTIRLYKRTAARFPGKSIHDQVEINGRQTTKGNVILDASIGKLTHPILHYPYKNIMIFFRKWAQYAMWEGDEQYKKGVRPSFGTGFSYLIVKPKMWFLKTYFRHKGFVDGFPGFMFSVLSGLRFWVEYMRIVELSNNKK